MITISTREPLQMVSVKNIDDIRSSVEFLTYFDKCNTLVDIYKNSILVLVDMPHPQDIITKRANGDTKSMRSSRLVHKEGHGSANGDRRGQDDVDEELLEEIEEIYRYVRDGGDLPTPKVRVEQPTSAGTSSPPPAQYTTEEAKKIADDAIVGNYSSLDELNKSTKEVKSEAVVEDRDSCWEEPIYADIAEIKQRKRLQGGEIMASGDKLSNIAESKEMSKDAGNENRFTNRAVGPDSTREVKPLVFERQQSIGAVSASEVPVVPPKCFELESPGVEKVTSVLRNQFTAVESEAKLSHPPVKTNMPYRGTALPRPIPEINRNSFVGGMISKFTPPPPQANSRASAPALTSKIKKVTQQTDPPQNNLKSVEVEDKKIKSLAAGSIYDAILPVTTSDTLSTQVSTNTSATQETGDLYVVNTKKITALLESNIASTNRRNDTALTTTEIVQDNNLPVNSLPSSASVVAEEAHGKDPLVTRVTLDNNYQSKTSDAVSEVSRGNRENGEATSQGVLAAPMQNGLTYAEVSMLTQSAGQHQDVENDDMIRRTADNPTSVSVINGEVFTKPAASVQIVNPSSTFSSSEGFQIEVNNLSTNFKPQNTSFDKDVSTTSRHSVRFAGSVYGEIQPSVIGVTNSQTNVISSDENFRRANSSEVQQGMTTRNTISSQGPEPGRTVLSMYGGEALSSPAMTEIRNDDRTTVVNANTYGSQKSATFQRGLSDTMASGRNSSFQDGRSILTVRNNEIVSNEMTKVATPYATMRIDSPATLRVTSSRLTGSQQATYADGYTSLSTAMTSSGLQAYNNDSLQPITTLQGRVVSEARDVASSSGRSTLVRVHVAPAAYQSAAYPSTAYPAAAYPAAAYPAAGYSAAAYSQGNSQYPTQGYQTLGGSSRSLQGTSLYGGSVYNNQSSPHALLRGSSTGRIHSTPFIVNASTLGRPTSVSDYNQRR